LLQVWADAVQSKGSKLTDKEKWEAGTALIAKSGDPAAAKRVSAEVNNYYRLMRVLEIVLHTGKPLAEFEPQADVPLDYDFRLATSGTSWSDGVTSVPMHFGFLFVLSCFAVEGDLQSQGHLLACL